ncbi:OTU domain-containing protein 2 [[Candida] jaroonii]|uniref:OTU domain-containing protein 2 n=1 Tax=[Candida] jaroonii TaxID=467808 RepID=A0ACA9YEI1_9ASCO|nr:OTU domain-containing protein 2 [[Candida] jaroonii]
MSVDTINDSNNSNDDITNNGLNEVSQIRTLDDLISKHKSEKKDLQGKITGLKKQINKKNKKQIQHDIQQLEADLDYQQSQELADFQQSTNDRPSDETHVENNNQSEKINHISDTTEIDEKLSDLSIGPKKKRNRQKERLAKRNAKIQQMKDDALDESKDMVDYRSIEINTMNELLKLNKLKVFEVNADGNCLFNSIRDQLALKHELNLTIEELRIKASAYILAHPDDFIPFLMEKDEIIDIEEYCKKLSTTTMWGSDIEILAFSKIFDCPIEVYLVGANKLMFNDEGIESVLKIAFYKHSFGLGEHYNSLRDVN